MVKWKVYNYLGNGLGDSNWFLVEAEDEWDAFVAAYKELDKLGFCSNWVQIIPANWELPFSVNYTQPELFQ